MARVMLPLLLLGCARLEPSAAPVGTAPGDGRAERLVLELGDASLEVRERAHQALWEMGIEAEPVLRAHANDPDVEVAERCGRLIRELPVCDSEWYEAARVETVDLQCVTLFHESRHGLTYSEMVRIRSLMSVHEVTCVRLRLSQGACSHGHVMPSTVTAEPEIAPLLRCPLWEQDGYGIEQWLGRVARRVHADVEILANGEAHFLHRRAAFDRWWSEASCRYYRPGVRPHDHR